MSYAVLFDVDGVLVDSYQAHFESWRQLYAQHDYDLSEEEFRQGFGRTSQTILRDWAKRTEKAFDEAVLEQLDDHKEALYREIVRADFVEIKGAGKLIDELHAAGFKLGIGSSGPPENVEVVVERLERADKFSAVVSRVHVSRGKPDPEVFLRGAERLDVAPEQCAVIEDAAAGIQAANSAGMTSIALTGTASREELAAADLVVDCLTELSADSIRDLIDR